MINFVSEHKVTEHFPGKLEILFLYCVCAFNINHENQHNHPMKLKFYWEQNRFTKLAVTEQLKSPYTICIYKQIDI